MSMDYIVCEPVDGDLDSWTATKYIQTRAKPNPLHDTIVAYGEGESKADALDDLSENVVVISVKGGIAEVEKAPDSLKIVIQDRDHQ